ncbi:hypothetical protein OCK74_01190 [Chitinophagaceae bacterium LB-8]|uniref:HMA domain-containing protein n=1 Tax=Paraflavisolibacter caeni TaxID=2982496 RepID=A0A9X3BGG1_9BACT|nr:hypothetical protein [Paraflavisolibacter caeni]MCU7547702.1 hypothetical protein [Paraflavisolibacter caeni]
MSTYHFKTNINCLGCVTQIKPKLDQLEQDHTIEHWHVNMNDPEYLLEVETDKLSADEVRHFVREAGFEAEFTRASEGRSR